MDFEDIVLMMMMMIVFKSLARKTLAFYSYAI